MQKERVILYGFGWVGQSMLAFCEAMGFECRIVDDGINKDFVCDERVAGIEVFREPFALCLITVRDEEAAQRILAKLQNLGIHESLVRHVSSFDYRSSMAYLVHDFFGSTQNLLEFWRSESFILPNFHLKLAQLIDMHHKKRVERNQNLLRFRAQVDSALPHCSVFAKMCYTQFIKAPSTHIPYPGFNVQIAIDGREDKSFFFEKVDWDLIQHRDANTKLIVCFGNSALRLVYLPLHETIIENLRKELQNLAPQQNFIVLNLGINGYTIYEQMMLYNALIYPHSPDIVLSFFGATDWRTGIVNCDVLLKVHKMTYTPGYYEYQAKSLLQRTSLVQSSQLPLYTELEIPNPKISDDDVNLAIATRLRQFHDIVRGGGGKFAAFIQPLLPCKKVWAQEEKDMRYNEIATRRAPPYMSAIIDRVPELIVNLKQQVGDVDYLYDLNNATMNSTEPIFTNNWIHCNARGNALCAQYAAQVLRQKNWL